VGRRGCGVGLELKEDARAQVLRVYRYRSSLRVGRAVCCREARNSEPSLNLLRRDHNPFFTADEGRTLCVHVDAESRRSFQKENRAREVRRVREAKGKPEPDVQAKEFEMLMSLRALVPASSPRVDVCTYAIAKDRTSDKASIYRSKSSLSLQVLLSGPLTRRWAWPAGVVDYLRPLEQRRARRKTMEGKVESARDVKEEKRERERTHRIPRRGTTSFR
jgi:hypothetical protein